MLTCLACKAALPESTHADTIACVSCSAVNVIARPAATTCPNCGKPCAVLVCLRSPRGPYSLGVCCLGNDLVRRADAPAALPSRATPTKPYPNHRQRSFGT